MDFKELDLPGIVNGAEVESISKWFEDNADYTGPVEIKIPERKAEIYRVCVKKEMTTTPVLNNRGPMPGSQMLGKKVGNFAGFYIMELWFDGDTSTRWRGKVPKNMILKMELL